MSEFRKPQQQRSQKTYDAMLDAAGELLGEVGIERISSNLVCERAGVTPPAFYRYFDDKYGLLMALTARLMEVQNAEFERWLESTEGVDVDTLARMTAELALATARISDTQPGAVWIQRACRAVPRLSEIRLASHDFVAQKITDLYVQRLPHVPRERIFRRVRFGVEIGYGADEMTRETDLGRDAIFEDMVHVFVAMAHYADYARSE
ncbi:TetR/AcrR family transcriptional regulator [Novosphingobium profundi]|uniref:TetR/AcrR family transcriptional regulator n=1 Tax=Novosphingobium profundi TaxID=1774954 RepID=UPI001BD91FFE|nr:TetR/AcrR family transcriptional regulator [Novosphingobium profundi]MBT0670097.1 TetR/AcrR family transcriptional regulator [Novosphingobium profundi]